MVWLMTLEATETLSRPIAIYQDGEEVVAYYVDMPVGQRLHPTREEVEVIQGMFPPGLRYRP